MLAKFIGHGLCWALSLTLVKASAPLDQTVQIRNAPRASNSDTYQAIRREISKAALEGRDEQLKNSTTLDRSWDGAVLLKFGAGKSLSETNVSSLSVSSDIEIVCTTCYVKGVATAELSIDGEFNASQAIVQTINQFRGKVENFTESVDDYFTNYTKSVMENLDDDDDVTLDDFALPTFNFNFGDFDLPAIPECNLRFSFDEMELYMNIDTILGAGATYELSLYRSNTPLGISITQDLELGVIFAVDLILSVNGKIDINSGFHLQLEDGLAINIAMFGDDVSDIIFNGGKFEFLPVTLVSSNVVLSAVLRVGVHAGFSIVTPDLPEITVRNHTLKIPEVGGGIEVGVFANIAEFITNVTYVPEPEDKENCQLNIVQSYQLALGAKAGASVAFDSYTFGPVATTSIPIFNTELASVCAISKTATETPTPTITASAAPEKRQDLTTTTTTIEIKHTGVACISQGLVNCPASLQSTSQYTETKTIITAVPEGSSVILPASVQDKVPTTVAFGSNAATLPATTGSPVSYIPPPPTATAADDDHDNDDDKALDGEVGRVSKKTVVGVSVGLGMPALVAVAAGLMFLLRRRRYSAVPKSEAITMIAEPYGQSQEPYAHKSLPKQSVEVRELGRR